MSESLTTTLPCLTDETATAPLVLLDTGAFVDELVAGIAAAQRRIELQLMTFDGDDAGQMIAAALLEAADRGLTVRLLIDSFVEKVVSDTNVRYAEVAAEFAATNEMFDRLRAGGVEIKFTHPVGPLSVYALVRNHKKIVLIDDVAFIGGVNVSDHNFVWNDFMVRLTDPAVVVAVSNDFQATWDGKRESIDVQLTPTIRLLTNRAVEPVFSDLLRSARSEVIVASPYAEDIHLVNEFEQCSADRRVLLSPETSNAILFRFVNAFVRRQLARVGVELRSNPEFSHAKFVLVDDRALLVGSSNFGRHSFRCNQEICLLITDPDFITEVRSRQFDRSKRIDHDAPRLKVALSRLVTYGYAIVVEGLIRTAADRVPPLSSR